MIAVIGDIHGCFHTLIELVNIIKTNYPGVPLYTVGDLVDRGNYSFEVLEFVLDQNIRFTPGNHDYMFYYFVKDPSSALGRAWLYNGSEATINSYNNRMERLSNHLDLIINAPLFINLNDCFISHAGISKFLSPYFLKGFLTDLNYSESIMKKNTMGEHGLLWTRDELMNIGKLQIVGHTRQQHVNYLPENNVAYIDTSVYTGNQLSAVIVENNKILKTFSVPTFKLDIE